jgi:hypothetical protein
VIIARRDKPVVRLDLITDFTGGTRIGGLKGKKLKMGAKFDDSKLSKDIARSFEEA